MIDAYEIGISLALQDGVSAGIALIRRELAALDQAIAATASNLAHLTQAGGIARSPPVQPTPRAKLTTETPPAAAEPLSVAPSVGTAAIPVPSPDIASSDTPRSARAFSQPAIAAIQPTAATPPPKALPPVQQALPVQPTFAALPVAASPPIARAPSPRHSTPPRAGAILPIPVAAPAIARAQPDAVQPPPIAVPPLPPSPPAVLPTIPRLSPPTRPPAVPSPPLPAAASVGPRQHPGTPTEYPASRHQRQTHQHVSAPISHQPTQHPGTPPVQPTVPPQPPAKPLSPTDRSADRRNPRSFEPPAPTSGSSAPPAAPTRPTSGANSPSPNAASFAPPPQLQPTITLQGDVILDGSRVGRWMAATLARQAARPPAGATGPDPRQTPLWSGQAQGF